MRRISTITLTLAAAVALSGCIIVADGGTTTVVHHTVPAEDAYAAALAHPDRPEADRARDGLRRSADMLAFMRLEPGDVVADIRPEEGFFTRLVRPRRRFRRPRLRLRAEPDLGARKCFRRRPRHDLSQCQPRRRRA